MSPVAKYVCMICGHHNNSTLTSIEGKGKNRSKLTTVKQGKGKRQIILWVIVQFPELHEHHGKQLPIRSNQNTTRYVSSTKE